MFKTSSFVIGGIFAANTLLLAGAASAALTSTTWNTPVTIDGAAYFVTFNKQTQAATTFNEVYGSTPSLTFTSSATAMMAVNAIVANVPASSYDPFGVPSSGFAGFFVPFVFSANGFNRAGANYLLPNGPAFILGVPNNNDSFGRNQSFNFSFVTFTVVPTPGSVALLGLGGLVALRRRRA